MSDVGVRLRAALDSGAVSGRLWLYSNYHCNLACTYCLTESGPTVPRRALAPETMLGLATDAADLGFTGLGVTGGEPFLVTDMPELLAALADRLPLVVLSNGTLFTPGLVDRMAPLAHRDVAVQISLDSPDPDDNDALRGRENFRKVVEAVPRLVDAGLRVRIATTIEDQDDETRARLCALHRSLGVGDEDHVVRPVVRRGRASENGMGVTAALTDLEPELTITVDGAFWSPFAPTVAGGRLDTDLLLARTVAPLSRPVRALLDVAEGRPPGSDATLGIR